MHHYLAASPQCDPGFLKAAMMPDAVFIHGDIKSQARGEEYAALQAATNKVLIATYGIASTGIDIPRIFNLVLFHCGKSFSRTIQSAGRGLRRANDKFFVAITDISSTLTYSRRHLSKRRDYYREAGYPCNVTKVSYR